MAKRMAAASSSSARDDTRALACPLRRRRRRRRRHSVVINSGLGAGAECLGLGVLPMCATAIQPPPQHERHELQPHYAAYGVLLHADLQAVLRDAVRDSV